MNKNFKKLCVSIALVVLMTGFESESLCAMQNDQKVDFSKVVDVFYSALRTVKNLNYYTADGVRFKVLDQEIVFDLGFAGHGNIFMPFTPVSAKVVFGKDNIAAPTSDDATFANFAKIVIENELYKKGKDLDFVRNLIDFKLSPMQVFSFKFMILLNTARVDGDWARLIEESFCLLFKLSQSKDVELIGKDKRFSEYLPEIIKNVLRESKFGLVEFIDDIWCVLTQDKSLSIQMLDKPAQVKGFVFKDESFAKNVYEKFKNYSGTDLYEQINLFIKTQGYDLIDIKDFSKFRSDLADNDFNGNEFVKKLIGYEDFLLSNNSDKPAELITLANSLVGKSGLIFVPDAILNEYWVAYVTQDVSFVNALKEVILVLVNSFKEYLQTKKTIFEGKDDPSLKYKAEFDAREKCRIELEKFVGSDVNKQILEDIKREINLIIGVGSGSEGVRQEYNKQDKISALETEISKLEKQKSEKIAELEKWQNILILQNGKNTKDIQIKIDAINAELLKISAQVANVKKDLDSLRVGGGEVVAPNADVKKDEQRLVQLYKILDDKKASGVAPSEKLLNAIKVLEQRVVKPTKQPDCVKAIDGKLAVRESVAKLLESKANELTSNVQSQLKDLDLISDFEDRVVQELLIDENIHMQKVFIEQLNRVASKIRSDNLKAKKLEAYRKAFAVVGSEQITDEKLKERTKLELEVGHIIDSESHENFVSEIMLRESFLSCFIKDMTDHADKFEVVRQRLQNSLSQILQNSSHFKNNSKLYIYLWRHSMPFVWKSLLNCVGISEKSFS